MNTISKPKRFRQMDGLRGIAAISVMVYHLMPTLPFGLVGRGFLAVDLFFLLSGFVIAHTYENKLLEGWSIAKFAIARAIRLYPLVFPSILSLVLLHSIYPHPSMPSGRALWDALLNALLLPNIANPETDRFPIIGPTWSLFYEITVNLIYAVAVPWLSNRILVGVILSSGIVFALLAWGLGSVDMLRFYIIGAFVRTVFSFSIGIWSSRNIDIIKRLMGFMPINAPYIIMLVVILTPRFSHGDWAFEIIAVALIFPVILFGAINAQMAPDGGRTEELLGEISYPLYLLHMPVAAYTGVALGWLLNGLALQITAVVAAILASGFAWSFYDKPVRRWLNRRITHNFSAYRTQRAEP